MSKIIDILKDKRKYYYLTNDERMLYLFHGSDKIVSKPDIRQSVNHSECGAGFYSFVKVYGAYAHRCRFHNSIINIFAIDLKKLENDIDIVIQCGLENIYIYSSKTGITNMYSDTLFVFEDGGSFVSYYGGQVFIRKQEVIDEYIKYIGSGKYSDLQMALDFNMKEHGIRLRNYYTSLADIAEVATQSSDLLSAVVGSGMLPLENNMMWEVITHSEAAAAGLINRYNKLIDSFECILKL